MSVCAPCTAVNSVPQCTDSLVLGTVVDGAASYYVFIQDLSTGKLIRLDGVLVGFSLSAVITDAGLTPGRSYEIYATKTTESIDSKVTITVGTTDADCFSFQIKAVQDINGDPVSYPTYSLSIAT